VKIVKFDVAPLAPGTTLDGENQERQILVGTLSGLASPLNTIIPGRFSRPQNSHHQLSRHSTAPSR
jgi:hypothetical protein